ncbi:MAG: ParB N-terminal domain-containing protein, partial [Planctomycetota bacterium]
MRKLTDIKPYPGNPRVNASAVAASIQEFGFRQPIVVDEEGVIIAGDTRYKAAQKLGRDEVPAHVATGLTPAQIKAYRIADNATADLAGWDLDLLPKELAELDAADFDLSLLGFPDEELARLLNEDVADGLTDPDEVPEPPDEPTTKPGDLWTLGDHRLLCGDSGDPDHVDGNRLVGPRQRGDLRPRRERDRQNSDRRRDGTVVLRQQDPGQGDHLIVQRDAARRDLVERDP